MEPWLYLDSVLFRILMLGLFLIVFLIQLNGHMDGIYTQYMDIILSIGLVAILICMLVSFGWRSAILGVLFSLVVGAILIPTAARLAARIRRH